MHLNPLFRRALRGPLAGCVFLPLLLFSHPVANAQSVAPEGASAAAKPVSGSQSVPEQLATIQRDIDWLTQEIASKRREQARLGNKEDAAEAEQDIADLETRLDRARLGFITTAADVELSPAEDKNAKPQKRDLMQEAQSLVEPLFDAIRRVSEKPRRIESLRTRLFYLKDRIAQIDRAVAGLDRALHAKSFPTFDKQLEDSKRDLLHERDDLDIRATAIDRKLSQELEDHRTLMQVVSEDVEDFAATKGKNLALALLAFAITLWSLIRLKRVILHSEKVRYRLRGLSRPFHAAYGLASGLLAVFAAVFTLHFLNDWFLASLVMLGLFATIWALKTVLHHFIAELKLLLNLGTAKQGERVVWMGIPWLVKTLGFRSILVNEALQGGTVCLPAATLSTLLSRETIDGEPWFPTKPGDFVLLDDGAYGKVDLQTPEVVVITVGGARKHYQTAAYLAKNPQNFSSGFEVSAEVVVRAEYSAKEAALETSFKQAARARLAPRLAGATPALRGFDAGLAPSGSGRLRAWVRAECPGALASERDALRRELQLSAGGALREVLGIASDQSFTGSPR